MEGTRAEGSAESNSSCSWAFVLGSPGAGQKALHSCTAVVCLHKLDMDVFRQEGLHMTKEMPPDSAVPVLVFSTTCGGHICAFC